MSMCEPLVTTSESTLINTPFHDWPGALHASTCTHASTHSRGSTHVRHWSCARTHGRTRTRTHAPITPTVRGGVAFRLSAGDADSPSPPRRGGGETVISANRPAQHSNLHRHGHILEKISLQPLRVDARRLVAHAHEQLLLRPAGFVPARGFACSTDAPRGRMAPPRWPGICDSAEIAPHPARHPAVRLLRSCCGSFPPHKQLLRPSRRSSLQTQQQLLLMLHPLLHFLRPFSIDNSFRRLRVAVTV